MKQIISDEVLGAYIDNELGPDDQADLLDRIASDAEIRSRACELWQLKQMMRSAYQPIRKKAVSSQPPSISHSASARPSTRTLLSLKSRLPISLAASLLMVVGVLSGWFAHERTELEGEGSRLSIHQMNEIQANGSRVVLHLVSDEPEHMEAALRMAEQLASARDKSGRPIQVEFIANGTGVHLLRVGGSTLTERVMAQSRAHPNLQFLACRQTVDRLRERGVGVELLSIVREAPSAESLLAARLSQGWRYVQA